MRNIYSATYTVNGKVRTDYSCNLPLLTDRAGRSATYGKWNNEANAYLVMKVSK